MRQLPNKYHKLTILKIIHEELIHNRGGCDDFTDGYQQAIIDLKKLRSWIFKSTDGYCRNCGSQNLKYYIGMFEYEAIICQDCGVHHTRTEPILQEKETKKNERIKSRNHGRRGL